MPLSNEIFPALNEKIPWEEKSRSLLSKISNHDIISRLNLDELPQGDLVHSVEQNTWYECDGGRHIIEISKPYNLQHLLDKGEISLVSDVDDTLFKTTEWHKKEYGYICEYWKEQGVRGTEQNATAIYELSKILVPKLAEKEPRYTPKLNFILLEQFKRRQLDQRMSPEETIRFLKGEQAQIQEKINKFGEGVLTDYVYDKELLVRVLKDNHPGDYMCIPLIRDLFDNSQDEHNSVLRIVMTRGKIEGPLGQVYKVHQSGITTLPSVDIIMYTNDRKIDALLYLMQVFPQLKSKNMLLYDDNPNETAPFCELIETQGMSPFKLEIIQVRHMDSKRRDKQVIVQNATGTCVKKPYASVGYALQEGEVNSFDTWSEVQNQSEATIYDHYAIDGRAMGLVV